MNLRCLVVLLLWSLVAAVLLLLFRLVAGELIARSAATASPNVGGDA